MDGKVLTQGKFRLFRRKRYVDADLFRTFVRLKVL